MDDAKPDTNHVHTFPELAISLAEDESDMDLPALLECLRVDELRSIVKANSKVGRTLMQRPLHSILI
jgi:Fanconi-associated nuclease 1